MQGDAVAIVAMGMGTPRGAPTTWLGIRGELRAKVQRHRESFARRHISGCQRKVLLRPLSPVRADSCLLIKVHDGAPSVERVLLSSIHQMPEVPPKSPHVRDMGRWHHDNLAREGA